MNTYDDDTPGMDEDFQREVDVLKTKKDLASTLPPPITYQTDPEEFGPLIVSKSRSETDLNEDGQGRLTVTLTGRGKAILRAPFTAKSGGAKGATWPSGEYIAPRLQARFSPDQRPKVSRETGEVVGPVDFLYQMYCQAALAYEGAFGEGPKGPDGLQQLITFLSTRPIALRMNITGELDTMVVAIQGVRRG